MRSLLPVTSLALLVWLASIEPAAGQTDEVSFSTLDIGVRGAVLVNRTVFQDYWRSGPGLEVVVETPFRIGSRVFDGRLQGGVRVMRHAGEPGRAGDPPSVADFLNVVLSLGWVKPVALPFGLEGYLGGQLGNYQMFFDDPVIAEALRNESEMAVGLAAGVGLPVARRWRVHTAGTYLIVFTNRRIHQALLSAGVSRTLRTPGWLKTLLQ